MLARSAIVLFLTMLLAPSGVVALDGQLVDGVIASAALGGQEKNYQVYLPAEYQSSTMRYPVLYYLHAENECWSDGQDVIQAVDQLIAAGLIQPLIVVKFCGQPESPWASDFSGEAKALFADSELVGAYETYPVLDLVAYVDATFRTVPERDSRSVIGKSFGAQAAVRFALKHPDVFSGAASMSGMMDWQWLASMCAQVAEEQDYLAIRQYNLVPQVTKTMMWVAAHFAPNLDNPPWYLDFPCTREGQPVGEVWNVIDGRSPLGIARKLASDPVPHEGVDAVEKGLRLTTRILLVAAVDDPFEADLSAQRLDAALAARHMPRTLRLFRSSATDVHQDYQIERAVTFLYPLGAETWLQSSFLRDVSRPRYLVADVKLPQGVEATQVAESTVVISAIAGRQLEAPVAAEVDHGTPIPRDEVEAVDKSLSATTQFRFPWNQVMDAASELGMSDRLYLRLTVRGELKDGRFFAGQDWVFFDVDPLERPPGESID